MFIKKRNMENRIPVNKVRSSADYVISQLPGFGRNFRTPQLSIVCEELSRLFVEGGTTVDIGGSSGFHTSIMAQLGMKAICVDSKE
jgi:protein-L-isoaspartate O-methyltransferase